MRCLETDFVYLENPPAYEEVRDDFPWEQTIQAERDRRRQAEPVFSRLSDGLKRLKLWIAPRRNHTYTLAAKTVATDGAAPLRLLDVGCGSGLLAVDCCERFAAAGRDVTPIGLELSPQLANAAAQRFADWSGDVIAAPALDGVAQIEDHSIHVATLVSFLEHDPRPLELLRALRPKLARDGVAIVKVPNFASLNRRLRGKRWCGFRFPDHVNYFTPRTLGVLAGEAGYRVVRTDRPLLGDNMYMVIRPAA
ncbi:class I SAM-dependent methyltransferase [Botrimarina colliarenosi]|uniref:class I SAM-dependent methyltransferase n=1 Tax=Botrimarina colliarenosi TaxID=2528001 RepID=UPI0018D45924|nr:class I SAM-dependent methyltransferase [Botrimarina colliarenosi]